MLWVIRAIVPLFIAAAAGGGFLYWRLRAPQRIAVRRLIMPIAALAALLSSLYWLDSAVGAYVDSASAGQHPLGWVVSNLKASALAFIAVASFFLPLFIDLFESWRKIPPAGKQPWR